MVTLGPDEKPRARSSRDNPAPIDPNLVEGADQEDRYSLFNPGEKKLITAIIGLSMIFSPLTANIYFPGLVLIQEDLNITPELVDLTITSYLIVQGISPVLFGDAADLFGRRPVFIVMFSVYVVANIALALQNSFVALLVLRMVQSLGCSATIAIAYGVIADVSTPAERGSMQGVAITAANVGPVLAPVIGGALVSQAGWHWVFWFLLIAGGVVLIMIVMFLPETARNIVGNGKVLPAKWGQPLVSIIFGIRMPKASQTFAAEPPQKRPARMLNPLRSFRILFYKDSFIVLLLSGIFYLIYYCVQASITNKLKEIYGFDESVIGACYLAIGVGVIIGGFVNGKVMNYNYKRQARSIGHQVDKVKGDNLQDFPIEKARTRSMVFLNVAHLATLAAYGWLLQKRVHVSGPLILQFVLGGLETCIVQTFNTLLVDIFPETPSTAAAAGNIVRCGLAAAGIAGLKPLMSYIGNGWYFTMLSIVGFAVGSVATYILRRFGMSWRLQRFEAER
ncbi:chloramphenicol resistance protein [Xylaria bambusicola]|uniref:chloramphenicol resistance protein n=1 Tax=Xylaria bambusicola TaxID=326684 RepID=UPI00200761CC|nr:chloramphenicol resistance protein [Xylaria bambusicola]KAI0521380.1 chloramphenicol resistance protein [Xylaria bambusicola]